MSFLCVITTTNSLQGWNFQIQYVGAQRSLINNDFIFNSFTRKHTFALKQLKEWFCILGNTLVLCSSTSWLSCHLWANTVCISHAFCHVSHTWPIEQISSYSYRYLTNPVFACTVFCFTHVTTVTSSWELPKYGWCINLLMCCFATVCRLCRHIVSMVVETGDGSVIKQFFLQNARCYRRLDFCGVLAGVPLATSSVWTWSPGIWWPSRDPWFKVVFSTGNRQQRGWKKQVLSYLVLSKA